MNGAASSPQTHNPLRCFSPFLLFTARKKEGKMPLSDNVAAGNLKDRIMYGLWSNTR